MSEKMREPLYKKIMDYVTDLIVNEALAVDQQLPTENELAERFEVSRITSRKALEELRHQGLIYRKRGGGSYVAPRQTPSSTVQFSEAGESHNIIALVLPCEATMGKLSDYIQGANEYLKNRNYFLTVHDTGLNLDYEKEVIESLVSKGVKGIIFYPFSDRENLQLLYDLYIKSFPIVTIDKYFESVPISSVISDNQDGGYQAAKHLLQLGHSRIAFVCSASIESATSIRNRYFGYCQAMIESGQTVDPSVVVFGLRQESKRWVVEKGIDYDNLPKHERESFDKQFVKELVQTLLDQQVTAIQTDDDYVAVELIAACLEMGIRIPDELSVIGFDNIELAAHIEVPLTTIEQDSFRIGYQAMEIIINKLEGNSEAPLRSVQPVKLVERSSCGKAAVAARVESGR